MKSFAVRLEPATEPRLAAALLLFHLVSAAAPWIARAPALLGAVLSAIALAGLALTLAQLPGRHCRLVEARHDGHGWHIRLAGSPHWLPAGLCPASRAYPALVRVGFRADRRRVGWLLRPGSVPADDFRRLKAHIRLAC